MAITITRTPWQDDDGTGTTGTVLNNAVKTDLYNQIDAALAKAAQLAGGNTFTGNQAITGTVGVVGAGPHVISAGLAGDVTLQVRNTLAGATARTTVLVGNDTIPYLCALVANSSTVGTAAWPPSLPNGVEIHAYGSGGLAIATDTNAPVRLFTNNLERARVLPTGEIVINAIASLGGGGAQFGVAADASAHNGIAIQNVNAAVTAMYFMLFYNAAAAIAGAIQQTGVNTVSYGTSSDARLKDDDGRATDVAGLRAVVVHDFIWKADGRRARGVFAQEAHAVFPAAITEGADELTDEGSLARPWMTDYSKFVPDLIVGWQQHDAELTELRAALAAAKG